MKTTFLAWTCLTLVAGTVFAQKSRRDVPPLPSNSIPVQVTVKTDKSVYSPEDSMTITGTTKNIQKDKIALQFSSGQRYDIEIREGKDGKGKQVWLWSKDKMFTQSLGNTPMTPNLTLTFTEKTPAPKFVGVYTVRFTITTLGRTPRAFGMTTFTVK